MLKRITEGADELTSSEKKVFSLAKTSFWNRSFESTTIGKIASGFI